MDLTSDDFVNFYFSSYPQVSHLDSMLGLTPQMQVLSSNDNVTEHETVLSLGQTIS